MGGVRSSKVKAEHEKEAKEDGAWREFAGSWTHSLPQIKRVHVDGTTGKVEFI